MKGGWAQRCETWESRGADRLGSREVPPGYAGWKQWSQVDTKVRSLLALGTSKRRAFLTEISSIESSETILDSRKLARRVDSKDGVPNSDCYLSRTLTPKPG